MAKEYHLSPFGTFINPWLSKADTKFNAAGLFHTELKVETSKVGPFLAKIQAAAEAALAEFTDDMTPGEKKKWKLYVPFKDEEDKDGNPTGFTLIDFKQNATIKLKDGTEKTVVIELKDSADKPFKASVFTGSEGRVMFTMRNIKMTGTKEAGVRLDFFQVQVTKLVKGGSGAGFGKVEGGFVNEGPDEDASGAEDNAQGNEDGEY